MGWLGIDIGGNSVRAAVCDRSGRLLGGGRAGGANIHTSGQHGPANVRDAVLAALAAAGADSAGVRAVGVGATGSEEAGRARVERLLDEALAGLGLPAPVLVADIDIAFRSASPKPDGVLLLAGTGAVAASYRGWVQQQRCDGMGALLGDEGSGVWLGRRVLRAVAAEIDRRGPATGLTPLVLDALGVGETDDPRQPMIAAATALPVAQWARFAPLAFELDGRDEVATGLLDAAAERLTVLAEAVGALDEVVFAGGLLASGALRERLRFSGPHAAHPVLGACQLAAESVGERLDQTWVEPNFGW